MKTSLLTITVIGSTIAFSSISATAAPLSKYPHRHDAKISQSSETGKPVATKTMKKSEKSVKAVKRDRASIRPYWKRKLGH